MKFEIVVTPLQGNRINSLFRFLVNDVVYRQQISAIGAYDVIKVLEDAKLGDRVDAALRQLHMEPWGRTPETMPVSTKKGARAAPMPRAPGRPKTGTEPYTAEDVPDRLPAALAIDSA